MSCVLKMSCSLFVEEEKVRSRQREEHVQRPGGGLRLQFQEGVLGSA